MYPSLNQSQKGPRNNRQSLSASKKNYFTKQIEESIVQLRSKFNVTSVKPYLSTYQIFFNFAIPKGNINQIPIKLIFYQKYPVDRPSIYVTKYLSSPIINEQNGQIKYEELYKWNPKSKILELMNKIHTYFINNGVLQDGFMVYSQSYKKALDNYAKQINKLTQPSVLANLKEPFTLTQLNLPQIPEFDFTNILKEKERQQKLQNNCQSLNDLYKTLVSDYKQTESKAQYISQRFGKGKILKEMQIAMQDNQVERGQGIENILMEFQKKRKNYHRMEILRQKYLES